MVGTRRVHLVAGGALRVLDLSSRGMLVEGACRLVPGRWVELRVVTAGERRIVKGRVVRAFVCGVASGVLRYRAGLELDRNSLPGEPPTSP